ncbi:hypothetical protein [Spongiactinospora gelatinilytica]|uniref:hypothetical protein n=1 Tax=Spongiactinospora gelatinilytica TaxID=2666298 RepID=UPI001F426B81|nr:hypothetical protein [Spongiactinospora gelatinilytica]
MAGRIRLRSPTTVITQAGLSWIELFPGPSSRPPSAVQIIALAEIYQTTPRRLLAPEALDRLPAAEREIVIRCDGGHAVPDDQARDAVPDAAPTPQPLIPSSIVPPRQRPVGGLQPEVEMAARRARRFVATSEASNVGPETLTQLREEIARIAGAYLLQPLPTLLFDLIECQDVAFRLLEGRQRPTESVELYLLAGITSGMLAKASHDMGDPHTALTQARAAFVCADNAGHDGLRAWTRGLQSLTAYWAGERRGPVREGGGGVRLAYPRFVFGLATGAGGTGLGGTRRRRAGPGGPRSSPGRPRDGGGR